MGIEFKFLEAGNGDSIYISTDNGINILIDGGWTYTYDKAIKPIVKNIRKNNQKLDLVILTHYDNDHIMGLYKLLVEENKKGSDTIIKEVWFNAFEKAIFEPLKKNNESKQSGAKKQKQFEEVIEKIKKHIYFHDHISINQIKEPIEKDDIVVLSPYTDKSYKSTKEIIITLLSPNDEKIKELKEEYEIEMKKSGIKQEDWDKNIKDLLTNPEYLDEEEANGSSIAFILEYKGKKFLLLGDAHIDLIACSLKRLGYTKENPLEVEFIKLSHHGSKGNISNDFLSLVKSKEFRILANSKTTHKHPDKETMVKIISHYRDIYPSVEFIFTYEIEEVFGDIELFKEEDLIENNLVLIQTSKRMKFCYQGEI